MSEIILSKEMTLAQVPESAESFIQQIVNGDVNPIRADYFLHCIEKLAETVRKNPQVKEAVLNEAEKWNGQTYNGNTPKIKERSNPVFDDPILKDLEKKVKSRKDLLKSITEDSGIIDEHTGQILEPIKYNITRFISWE